VHNILSKVLVRLVFMLNSCLQSLSKWNPLLFYQLPARHGEKSTQLSPILNLDTSTNLDLLDMETSVLHCVNPYDVNPIIGTSKVSDIQEESPTLGKPIKLEMEEFSDLGPFLPESAPKATSNFIDELNTPIFGEFGANKTRIGGNKGFI
jgi:hypothetical protein